LRDPFAALVAVLIVLQIKHFFCDYPFQSVYMLTNKGIYLHPGGILHAGLHALGSTAAFLVVTPTLPLGLAIVIGEFVVHYHLDWAKDQINRRMKLTAAMREFWWAIGADQLIHHLTYIAGAVLLVKMMLG
jgi:hypothetical protein